MTLKKNISMVAIITTFMVVATGLQSAQAVEERPIQTEPQADKSKKRFVVDYKGYNTVLKGLILIKRGNTRKPKLKAKPPTGTRISFVNKKITRYESNRVMFHMLKDVHKEFIRTTRQSLESIPAEFPMDNFSKDEQLAYWLNLRNITVLEAVMDIYPVRKLKRPWKKIANNKRLTIASTPMSINDIEALILKNWPNPQVIYGFYNGSVGGPNIRKRAYTGQSVWDDLKRNAKEFTNSVKGIQFYKKTAKISKFYENYHGLFPNFKNDVQKHMLANLRPNLGDELTTAKKVKFSVNDWSIADLMNGRLGLSSAGTIGPAALVNSVVSTQGARNRVDGGTGVTGSAGMKGALSTSGMRGMQYMRYPAHVQTYLRGMNKRMRESIGSMNSGNITIDEVDSKTTDVKVEQEKKGNENKKN